MENSIREMLSILEKLELKTKDILYFTGKEFDLLKMEIHKINGKLDYIETKINKIEMKQ